MGDEGSAERPLETGWLHDTPVGDSLLRRFVFSQSRVNQAMVRSVDGRSERTADAFLTDSGTPVPYFNQAILTRPALDPDDPIFDAVERWFGGVGRPVTLLSIWPTPDLRGRGWTLVGHPMMVMRSPGEHAHVPEPGVTVDVARSADEVAVGERVAIEGYPIDEAKGLGTGAIIPPAIVDSGVVMRVGRLDGEAVGVGLSSVGDGVVNLCLGATLPAARRRGVWEALVWARVADAPDLPAVAYTSDFSRPGFERMGFVPVTRFTLWVR